MQIEIADIVETKLSHPYDQDVWISIQTPDFERVKAATPTDLEGLPIVQKYRLKGYELTDRCVYINGCSFLLRKGGWVRGSIHFYQPMTAEETQT